jgi:hypothetical protein
MIVTPKDIRRFMRDLPMGELPSPQGNLLMDTVQFSDDEIRDAMGYATDFYNMTIPLSNIPPESMPYKLLLVMGTVAYLLQSESFYQFRNQVDVQDGDVAPTGIFSKGPLYDQLASKLMADFQQKVTDYKMTQNLNSFYAHQGSGFGGPVPTGRGNGDD